MTFITFFLLILVTVAFSTVFRQFQLPWVLAVITAGILIGPSGFEVVEMNDTLAFLGEIGLIFLMFIAGLETRLSAFTAFKRETGIVAVLNGFIPFVVGVTVGYLFGFTLLASVLLGIIFMSSSIAVIVPILESKGIIHRKLGSVILSSTIINDITSLVLLSLLLQTVDPISKLPLPSFYLLVIVVLVSLRYGLPKIRSFVPRFRNEQDLFESELRLIFVMLFGTVVLFEALGLHPIIAGFFSGLVLSDSLTSDKLLEKIHTIGYGVFIPIFFVVIGLTTDISVFAESATNLILVLVVVAGSLGAKFISGYVAGRAIGISQKESVFLGAATIPQLSTTLAVVATATALDILPVELMSAMVVLSMVSTMVSPLIIQRMNV